MKTLIIIQTLIFASSLGSFCQNQPTKELDSNRIGIGVNLSYSLAREQLMRV